MIENIRFRPGHGLAVPLVAVAMLATAAGGALADPAFTYGNSDDVKDVKAVVWTAAAEGGLVLTTGNSQTTTATAGIKTTRKSGNNQLAFDGAITYARASTRVLDDRNGNGLVDNQSEITTKDVTSAESLAGKLRYDRFLTKHNSLYIAALGARDVPAGKLGSFGGQVGYSRQVYKTKTAETTVEVGYDYSREILVSKNLSIHSVRGFIGHKDELTPGATLVASIEGLTNLNSEELPTGKDGSIGQDTRINTVLAISAKIGKTLSVQTSIEAHYDHRPAPLKIDGLAMGFVPEASRLDTIMKASLIYTLF